MVGPVTARTFRSDRPDTSPRQLECRLRRLHRVQSSTSKRPTTSPSATPTSSDNTDNSLIWISGTNLTFENNKIHDAGLRSGSGAHTECMYVWEVTNLTLKRNHFYHCAIMDVFITGSAVSNGGYIENNVFEHPSAPAGYAFHFRNGGDPSPDPNNWDFRYNTFVGRSASPAKTPSAPAACGHRQRLPRRRDACGQSNTTFSYNAFVRGLRHEQHHQLRSRPIRPASPATPRQLRPESRSVLLNKGNPTSYPLGSPR